MKIVTPARGLIILSKHSNPLLFSLAKVGMGVLGVVVELTLECIPQLNLKEQTQVFSSQSIISEHIQRLVSNRHVRYMWIPYTDTVVSVVSNPTTDPITPPSSSQIKAIQPMLNLLHELSPVTKSQPYLQNYSFAQIRDILLAVNPLDVNTIRRVNKAEEEYWQSAQMVRVDDSAKVLGFDCGGQQLVLEVCFPIGKLKALDSISGPSKDIQFVQKLMNVSEYFILNMSIIVIILAY